MMNDMMYFVEDLDIVFTAFDEIKNAENQRLYNRRLCLLEVRNRIDKAIRQIDEDIKTRNKTLRDF